MLCAIGLWIAIAQHAKFTLGGDDYGNKKPIHVDAHGLDAMAIGFAIIAVGIVNLALAIRSHRRIPVFWTGAGLLMATAAYGIVKVFA